VLDLSGLTVLDFPDGKLADLDPRSLEDAVEERMRAVEPEVVVTYAVHGLSGHPDHIVAHAVVKRAFCALRDDDVCYLQRLALYALPPEADPDACPSPACLTSTEDIDIVVEFEREDLECAQAALDCYITYRDVIEENRPLRNVERHGVCFEAFQTSPRPRLRNLTAALSEN
jgi:LmbE family N-acetylglucosaminyl deacetylase